MKRRNEELIDIVIQKVQKEYEEDIDLIGVFGSFFTGDFHEKSDLDLLVVLNNEKGWGFSTCFLLDGVGYDLYGSPWTKLEKMASFDHTFVSNIIDLDIVYCRKPEYRERLMKLRQKALSIIDGPMTKEFLQKTKTHLDDATLTYGKMILEEEIGSVRQLSGSVLYHLTNTVCYLNHNCFRLGVKHHLEEILAMEHVPKYFEQYFNGVMNAISVAEIKENTTKLMKTVKEMYDDIEKDVLLAFSAGTSCQDFYNTMHKECGTISIDLMRHFQANSLDDFANEFEKAMQLYKEDYDRLHMQVLTYDSIDEFRKDYLGV